jgi:hypothetical protein
VLAVDTVGTGVILAFNTASCFQHVLKKNFGSGSPMRPGAVVVVHPLRSEGSFWLKGNLWLIEIFAQDVLVPLTDIVDAPIHIDQTFSKWDGDTISGDERGLAPFFVRGMRILDMIESQTSFYEACYTCGGCNKITTERLACGTCPPTSPTVKQYVEFTVIALCPDGSQRKLIFNGDSVLNVFPTWASVASDVHKQNQIVDEIYDR